MAVLLPMSSQSKPVSKLNPGRLAALRTLVEVERGAHAEDRLPVHAPTGGSDRGLAWHLALGTLRWQGALDHHLKPLVTRPLAKLDPTVRCALRMGTFENHRMNAPARAVVHQTVEAVKRLGYRRAAGVVNAVLRKSAHGSLSTDSVHLLPDWLDSRWRTHTAWLERIRTPAPLSIAGVGLEDLGLDPTRLGGDIVRDLWTLPPGSGSVDQLDGFDEGRFWVMDAAAARVADMAANVTPDGGTVLDACAAPGGKTFRLLTGGFRVTSVDVSPERIERFMQNAQRLRLDVACRQHDWVEGQAPTLGTFDTVLVDAPCTGLGTVRRHPEILWRRAVGDPAAMAIAQRQIVQNALHHVKPGGHLIYAVCSMEPEEGVDVAASIDGWAVEDRWASAPPTGDEDGFQVFRLKASV